MKHRITGQILARACVTAAIFAGFASQAVAEPKLRGETFCFPAKTLDKLLSEVAKVDDDRRDVVDITLAPRFIIKDGGVWPTRYYLRAEDNQVATEFTVSHVTGEVPGFIDAVKARPDTDICVDDPTRAARPYNDEGLYFETGLSPLFHNRSGTHPIAELEEGKKDGKKFYKKMLPDMLAMFMPDTDYFAIRYDIRDTEALAFAETAEGRVPLALEKYKDTWVVSYDQIEDLEGDALIIEGGTYALQPVPSPETMRQYGWGEHEEE